MSGESRQLALSASGERDTDLAKVSDRDAELPGPVGTVWTHSVTVGYRAWIEAESSVRGNNMPGRARCIRGKAGNQTAFESIGLVVARLHPTLGRYSRSVSAIADDGR